MLSILYQGKVVEGQVSKAIEEKWSTSGVYSSDTGKCYLVPVDAVPIAGARLRLTKSRNNQEKGIRWAKEFEI